MRAGLHVAQRLRRLVERKDAVDDRLHAIGVQRSDHVDLLAAAADAGVEVMGDVELAWRLPMDAKLHGRTTKWVLRQVLERHVPASLVERPKMGFGLPIGAWLRGPLRPWAEELLAESRLRQGGVLDPGPIRRAWRLHLAGRRDLGYELWDVLILQAWLDRWRPAT